MKRLQVAAFITLIACLLTSAQRPAALHNGIVLPRPWPSARNPTQAYVLPLYINQPPAAIPVDTGRQLFVDDFLIENTTLVRVPHRPRIDAAPVMSPGTPPDMTRSIPYSGGVWYDSQQSMFRMWYWGEHGAAVSYAYSTDGRNWVKPKLKNAAIAPPSNMVIDLGGGRDSSTVWMDVDAANPQQRYKAFVYTGGNRLSVFYSPDGTSWMRQPFSLRSLSDRTTVFWNPFTAKWVTSARSLALLPASRLRPARTARSRFYLESPDLQTWLPTDPTATFWTGPDENDPPYPDTNSLPELYNLDAVAYESLLVGLFSWYYPPPGPDIVEVGVGFSRDGFQWVRPTRGGGPDAFISAGNHSGRDAYNIQSTGGCFLVVGEELYFYFSARDVRHQTPGGRMSTGLAVLRRDGFYSMDAAETEQTLTTRPITFSGDHLFINVDNPEGELRVEVLGEDGSVIPDLSHQQSTVIHENSTRRAVTWANKTTLAELSGVPVRLRFYLRKGSLYSFWITDDPGGASHGYVAAGGPGFFGLVDRPGSMASLQQVLSQAAKRTIRKISKFVSAPGRHMSSGV